MNNFGKFEKNRYPGDSAIHLSYNRPLTFNDNSLCKGYRKLGCMQIKKCNSSGKEQCKTNTCLINYLHFDDSIRLDNKNSVMSSLRTEKMIRKILYTWCMYEIYSKQIIAFRTVFHAGSGTLVHVLTLCLGSTPKDGSPLSSTPSSC